MRGDERWLAAARAYVDVKTRVDVAATVLDEAKKILVELCAHRRECGAGVTVMRVKKVRSVDSKRIPELVGGGLEQYRGEDRKETHIHQRPTERGLLLDLR